MVFRIKGLNRWTVVTIATAGLLAGCAGLTTESSADGGNSSGQVDASSSSVATGPVSSSGMLVDASSSAGALSSSSVAPFDWLGCVAAGDCGTITDARDQRVYKWVAVGSQVWMAENLDFGTYATFSQQIGVIDANGQMDATDSSAEKSCPNAQEASCATLGALYQWHTVMALPAGCDSMRRGEGPCVVDAVHRGICPVGWHVARADEFSQLADFVDSLTPDIAEDFTPLLKSTNGWPAEMAGTDRVGWNAQPTGQWPGWNGVPFEGCRWWMISEFSEGSDMSLDIVFTDIPGLDYDGYTAEFQSITRWKNELMSARCVQD